MRFLLPLLFLTSPAFASPRTVMVQLFEWPWADVARECEEYLGPNGFAAVQVSPPQESLVLGKNAWWERYQPVSFAIDSRSGDEAAFVDMVERCHAARVDIYVDAVINHMAGIAEGVGSAGTKYKKYNHDGLFTPDDFHFCGKNGNNQIVNFMDRFEVQFCELLGLADLKTESEHVRDTLAEYLNRLLDMGVAGFRIDSAKHIPASDLQAIVSRLKRRPFVVSETYIGQGEPVTVQEYFPVGNVNLFDYAFGISASFNSGHIAGLPGAIAHYIDSRKAVVFVENHDLQRTTSSFSLGYSKDPQAYWLANVFMMTWPYGYPQLFSGYSFTEFDEGPPVDRIGRTLPVLDEDGNCTGPWLCEHRLPGFAALAKFRNYTDSSFYASQLWTRGDSQLAFSRGTRGFVAINAGASAMRADIPTDLPDGAYRDLLGVNGTVHVQNSMARVTLAPRSAVVLQASIKKKLQKTQR